MTRQVLLASASPRRRQILADLGIPFTVCPSDVDESILPGESPEAAALRLAHDKALAAAAAAPGALVVAADTIVVLDGEILGKPGSAAEARRYLDRLRGRDHRVATAVVVLDAASGRAVDGVAWTTVWMRDFSDAERDAYVDTGDPMDKAGAYAIQHPLFQPVSRIDGSRTNVVGLPVELLQTLLDAVDGSGASSRTGA